MTPYESTSLPAECRRPVPALASAGTRSVERARSPQPSIAETASVRRPRAGGVLALESRGAVSVADHAEAAFLSALTYQFLSRNLTSLIHRFNVTVTKRVTPDEWDSLGVTHRARRRSITAASWIGLRQARSAILAADERGRGRLSWDDEFSGWDERSRGAAEWRICARPDRRGNSARPLPAVHGPPARWT